MAQSRMGKQKKIADSVLKQLEDRLGKDVVDNPHFQSFVFALVQSETLPSANVGTRSKK